MKLGRIVLWCCCSRERNFPVCSTRFSSGEFPDRGFSNFWKQTCSFSIPTVTLGRILSVMKCVWGGKRLRGPIQTTWPNQTLEPKVPSFPPSSLSGVPSASLFCFLDGSSSGLSPKLFQTEVCCTKSHLECHGKLIAVNLEVSGQIMV